MCRDVTFALMIITNVDEMVTGTAFIENSFTPLPRLTIEFEDSRF